MKTITANDFRRYLVVQLSGKYNMFSSEAIIDTGLDKDTYFNIIKHYKELIEKYKETDECNELLKRLGKIR